MFHPEPERLALGALEGYTDDVERHLAECPECAQEAESLRRVVDAGRGAARSDARLERPSDAVWDRIADELGLDRAASPVARLVAATSAPTPVSAPAPAPAVVPAPRRSTPQPWWRRPTAWVAAAALVVGALGAVVVQQIIGSPDAAVVASAELTPLPGWDAEGRAEVETTDGQRVLVVDLAADAPQGYLEVWLISSDLERLISLGVLTGSEGRFELPPDLDLEDFAIVDVSAEALDGNPAHSGDSIVRGELA